MENSRHTDRSFQRIKRYTLAFAALLYVFYGWNGVLPHQLAFAPLFDISLDNTFWAFHLTGIPSALIRQPLILILLEVALLGIGILSFFQNRITLNIAFLLLFLILLGIQQTYSCTLTKTGVVFPIVFLPFCLPEQYWTTTRKIPRYYLVYLMVSAGIFKLVNGGLFHPQQMQNILANQHLDLIFYESKHISKSIQKFILSIPNLPNILYWLTAVVEVSFIALIFTKKWDGVFAGVLILFCIGIYLVFRIYTLDILALIFPILPFFNRND